MYNIKPLFLASLFTYSCSTLFNFKKETFMNIKKTALLITLVVIAQLVQAKQNEAELPQQQTSYPSQPTLRPDDALHKMIQQASMEKHLFPNIQTRSESTLQNGQKANSDLARIVRKRKAIEAFEQEYKSDFTPKGKKAIEILKKESMAAENKLRDSLQIVENLLTTAYKKLNSTIKNHQQAMGNLKKTHASTSSALAYESPVITFDRGTIEQEANDSFDKNN